MKMLVKLALLVVILNEINAASFKLKPLEPSEAYTHSAVVDEDDPNLYQVFWKLINNDEIQFELHCRTTGYVGIGLSTNGGMTGADIAISWVNRNGAAFTKDTYASDFKTPMTDKHQDWFLIEASELNGYTIVKLKRKLNTCDKEEDFEIKDETHYLLFAWNNIDPATGNNDWVYHGPNRRIKVDILLNFKNETLSEESEDVVNAIKYDYFLPNIPIKKQKTYYFCQLIPWPQYEKNVHLIRYDILADKANRDLFHHLVVYDCPPIQVDSLQGRECGAVPVPQNMNLCLASPVIISWAIGGQKNFTFPKETGLPHYKLNRVRYVLAEYHFDNPRLDENRKDNTGLRLYFTETLRKHELGVITLGSEGLLTFTDITIPPKVDSLIVTSTCYPQCTEKFLPNDGITLLSGFLHTHMAGRAARTKLVRNNQVVKYLFDNPNYNFNYQFNSEIEPFNLRKGDKLITECVYSSSDRDNITFFGYSTEEEMCYNFVYYYPRVNSFDKCFSRPSLPKMFEFYEKLAADGLMPAVNLSLNSEELLYESLNQLGSVLKTQVNYTEQVKLRFKEFFEDPKEDDISCGSIFEAQDYIYGVPTPYVKPKELAPPEDKCRANSAGRNAAFNIVSIFASILLIFKLK